jgi:TetR/AcrR family transcriptional repressor of nem operon
MRKQQSAADRDLEENARTPRHCERNEANRPPYGENGLFRWTGIPRLIMTGGACLRLRFKDQSVYILAMSRQTPVQLPRGRPRSFDVEAAVERAMGVFWSRGYHATALPDLLRATKLSRGSLYAAFGDKHSLFLRALDRYIADALTRMNIELDPRREPIDGLRAYLAGYVDRTTGAKGRRGCLLVATAMELAGQDAEVGRRVAGFFKAMEARVVDALTRAKTAGKLADGVEPSVAARILVCFVEGLRVVGKTAPTRITSQATADALLDRFTK